MYDNVFIQFLTFWFLIILHYLELLYTWPPASYFLRISSMELTGLRVGTFRIGHVQVNVSQWALGGGGPLIFAAAAVCGITLPPWPELGHHCQITGCGAGRRLSRLAFPSPGSQPGTPLLVATIAHRLPFSASPASLCLAALNVTYVFTHLVGWKWGSFKFRFPSGKWFHSQSLWCCPVTTHGPGGYTKTAHVTTPLPVCGKACLSESTSFFRAVTEEWMFGKCSVISAILVFNSRALKSLDKSGSQGAIISVLLAGHFLDLSVYASWQPSVTSLWVRYSDFFPVLLRHVISLCISCCIECLGIW